MEHRQIIVIGAGVTGCAIARYLSRYESDVLVLEAKEDVCCGTSKANSGIVHAGFDAAEGSLMARFNVRGNKMMEQLSRDLDFSFKKNGSLVTCLDEADKAGLEVLLERGKRNGVEELSIISGDEARAIEPNLSENVVAALYAPTGGIVCPFGLTIALAENAASNGVEFRFNQAVSAVKRNDDKWVISVEGAEDISCDVVVNAAGVYADVIHNMVSEEKIHITPRRGQYMLMDKAASGVVKQCTVFQQPGKYGKGVLVTPTVHGNLLVGPTAEDIDDKEDVSTTAAGLSELSAKGSLAVTGIPFRSVITAFSGLRAHEDNHEFVLGEPKDAKNFLDAAGIESPGLTSAPAIGEYISDLAAEILGLSLKDNFISTRKGIPEFSALTMEEKNELIKKDVAYGAIVCRCEGVTEGEIREAIRRVPGATTTDGVKRRTRAGMGRCQAGFCTARTMEILAEELGTGLEGARKNGTASAYVYGRTREAD